ncbi:hypothetical protein V9T40_011801 [Parthenolecanium corni]|uniref:Uncharacterized protein n=1 Tax=Parthenolecanium corni TaxID=536013 RepID=A0AAN9T8F9_9HEMI
MRSISERNGRSYTESCSCSYLHFAAGSCDGHAILNIIPSIRMKTSRRLKPMSDPFMVTTAARTRGCVLLVPTIPPVSFYHFPLTQMP